MLSQREPQEEMKTRRQATHDYGKGRRYWGHDYVWEPRDNGKKGTIMGWGSGIEKGDYIIMENGEQGSRYQFKKIRYMLDPKDMFEGELIFAPRKQL